jgi:hypothetical protein
MSMLATFLIIERDRLLKPATHRIPAIPISKKICLPGKHQRIYLKIFGPQQQNTDINLKSIDNTLRSCFVMMASASLGHMIRPRHCTHWSFSTSRFVLKKLKTLRSFEYTSFCPAMSD